MSMEHWYGRSINELVKDFSSDLTQGLSQEEAIKRLKDYGPNRITEENLRTKWQILLAQFKSLLIIILIVAGLSSLILGDWIEALAILFVVLLNGILGFVQENKADQSVKALKKLVTAHARVFRNGKLHEISVEELVPGDILLLECGDRIPADLRLFDPVSFQVDESMLTGESQAILKCDRVLDIKQATLGDMHNLAFMGTIVLNGRSSGMVIRTGLNTELGKIANLTRQVDEEKTPLEEKMDVFSKRLSLVLGLLCLLIFSVVFARNGLSLTSLQSSFIFAISLAVAAIPESLPAVTTIVLSTGVFRMSKKKAVVRKLASVETLGSTTVICTDKTGTITENNMRVTALFTADSQKNEKEWAANQKISEQWLRKVFYFNNDARIQEAERMGDPTELALLDFAFGLEDKHHNQRFKRKFELPFDSVRKRMMTVHEVDGETFVTVKGAFEALANQCTMVWVGEEAVPFDMPYRKKFDDEVNRLASEGYRILAAAIKLTDKPEEWTEEDLCMIGFVAMRDPIRSEVYHAIEKCRLAGIRIIMLTGDHVQTAGAYAKELKLIPENGKVYNHFELEAMSDNHLKELLKADGVFARITPEDKYRIVSLLKESGEIVAMTGDGVNDAPALRKADIGIAMGIRGTDLAREVSELVLLDDNFASIVNAIEEGRKIFDNIKKTIFFLISCNFGEILLVIGSLLLSLPIPLKPLQLLWLNLITDSFPALALGLEKAERNVMQPRKKKGNDIMSFSFFRGITFQAIFIGAGTLYLFLRYLPNGIAEAMTVCFAGLVMIELMRAFSARSHNDMIFRIGWWSNPSMIGAQMISFLFLLIALYGPLGKSVFGSVPLHLFQWIEIILVSSIVLIMAEIRKIFWKII